MTVGRIPNVEGGIQPTLLTTAGDIMYASSASNPARLGIGTASQILAVNSGATAPEWVTPTGGMTLLSTTSLSGATTTVSGISGSYTDLYIVAYGMQNATGNGSFRIAPNGSTTITDFNITRNSTNDSNDNGYLIPTQGVNENRTGSNHICVFTINQYASTAMFKNFSGTMYFDTDAAVLTKTRFGGSFKTTSAITSLVFSNSGGNHSAGTVLVYGVK
jgi:hypothetical protein